MIEASKAMIPSGRGLERKKVKGESEEEGSHKERKGRETLRKKGSHEGREERL